MTHGSFFQGWREVLWLWLKGSQKCFANELTGKRRNRVYTGPPNADFPGFLLRELDQLPLGYFFWKMTRTFPNAVALRPVAGELTGKRKMRGYQGPRNADFPGFSLRDLEQWPLCHFFWEETQTTLIAVEPKCFTNESTCKRRNERVHRPLKCIFSRFFRSMTLTYYLWIKCSEGWCELHLMQLISDQMRANWLISEEIRRYTGPKNADCAVRFVTLINDFWVTFSEQQRKLLWFQLIWDILQANRPVNEEMRQYTGSVFFCRVT